jgi:hypothetical protein
MTMTVPTTAQIAHGLERGARIAAPAIAFAITCIVLLAELAYALGRLTGEAIYARNEQLAAFWRHLWVPAAVVKTLPKRQSKTAPVMHPLALLASELQSCTSSEVRRITGSRRRCSKAELVAAYVAA